MNARLPPPTGIHHASKLEAALDAARRGFRVFPCVPDTKRPAVPAWQHWATGDEARIREKWDGRDWNIGTPCDGIDVVDVDPRNGGSPTFLQLSEEYELAQHQTLVSKTAGGGLHLIFRSSGERLKSRAHAFGPGVDLKTGAGAYNHQDRSVRRMHCQYCCPRHLCCR
jgi:hypothetical protein